MPFRSPSPTTPTRATCASTGRSIRNNSTFLRISDRKETGVNYPPSPFRSTARPTAPSESSTSRSPSATPTSSAQTKFSTLASASIAPRPASSISPSATRLSQPRSPGYIPGLPTNPVVAGGLPSIGITGFTGFGRQSTNPQWQDPALLDPKVNFTWVKGNHSMKFGYEYERVWMAVNDNNPLYGSFTYGGGYSVARSTAIPARLTAPDLGDNYWADFLFGTTNAYSLANYYVAHLTQNMHNLYAQDDWHVSPNLTLNLGLRWEYGSPYADLYNRISNWDPVSQTVLTTTPEPSPATASLQSTSAEPTARLWSIQTSPTSARASASLTRSIQRP